MGIEAVDKSIGERAVAAAPTELAGAAGEAHSAEDLAEARRAVERLEHEFAERLVERMEEDVRADQRERIVEGDGAVDRQVAAGGAADGDRHAVARRAAALEVRERSLIEMEAPDGGADPHGNIAEGRDSARPGADPVAVERHPLGD